MISYDLLYENITYGRRPSWNSCFLLPRESYLVHLEFKFNSSLGWSSRVIQGVSQLSHVTAFPLFHHSLVGKRASSCQRAFVREPKDIGQDSDALFHYFFVGKWILKFLLGLCRNCMTVVRLTRSYFIILLWGRRHSLFNELWQQPNVSFQANLIPYFIILL